MRLHKFTLRVLAVLAAASFIVPVTEASRVVTIVVYEEYPWKFGDDDTTNGINLADDDEVIFNLSGNYSISDYTPTKIDPITGKLIQEHPTWNSTHHFITGGSVEFTSSANSKVSFTDGYSSPFYQQKNLSFHHLSGLTFANIVSKTENGGEAIRLGDGGNVSIRNVTDNNSTTADVVFSNVIGMTSSDSYIGVIAGKYNSTCNIDISCNGDVSFLNNQGSSGSSIIYAHQGKISICDNEDVLFQDNGNRSGTILTPKGNIELNGNDSISFINNESTAISTDAESSEITMQNNGDITFRENGAYGIHSRGNCILNNNGNITFENNGNTAIYSYSGETHITNNKNLVFKGHDNVSINSQNLVNISGNQDVTFSDNTNHCLKGNNISISGNHNVSFANNQHSPILNQTSNGAGIYLSGGICSIDHNNEVTFTGNRFSAQSSTRGAAIYVGGPVLTIESNKKITFSDNVSYDGGAIYQSNGSILFNDNGEVLFDKNQATGSGNFGGGAIKGDVNFTQNKKITFSNNKSGAGGGIFGTSTFENNGDIIFSGNAAKSTGGAINGAAMFTNNGDITFNNNTAGKSGGSAIYGGVEFKNNGNIDFKDNISHSAEGADAAIRGLYSSDNIIINANKNVSFCGNKAISESSTVSRNAYAGALSMRSEYSNTMTMQICNNAVVEFSGNGAIAHYNDSDIYAGAIYHDGTKSLTIAGNDSVTFSGNYRYWKTEESDTLHLRGIYANSTLNLSAKSGGHITINDSVYASSTVNLNADYTDAAGEPQKATGAIIFSGKTTEQQLNTILEAEGANRVARESEIKNSRTSTFYGKTTLYGGSLQVKDQAILNVNNHLTVAAGSNAEIVVSNNAALNEKYNILLEEGGNSTLKVQGASVSAGTSTSYKIEIAGSNSLELSDGASITTNTVYIKSQASLSVADTMKRGAHALAEVAEAAPLVFNTAIGAELNANLNLAGGATFEVDGACIDMNGHNITFGVTSSTEKIALLLTPGAAYEEDSLILLFANAGNVTFSADKVTGKPTGSMLTLMAADYFSGDWINENTQLIYDQGNVYVTGVNTVQIPEPTTATLSLLALAALAARRRRR